MIAITGKTIATGLMVCFLATSAGAQHQPAWQRSERNDPNFCKDIWKAIGLPRYRSTAQRDQIHACHKRYVVSHNNTAKSPDWVIEHLTAGELTNQFSRPRESFSPDSLVPPAGRPTTADYSGMPNNFEIGHMAPSEDFNNNEGDMRESFLFSNAVPQVGDRFNAAIWKRLESEVRSAAKERGQLYVMTGPVRGAGRSRTIMITKQQNRCGGKIELNGPPQRFVCAAGNTPAHRACGSGVVVPIAIYKIIYDPDKKTVHAFIMPNRNHDINLGDRTHAYLDGFRVDVGRIEQLTGVKFFGGLPAEQQTKIRRCEQSPFWAATLLH